MYRTWAPKSTRWGLYITSLLVYRLVHALVIVMSARKLGSIPRQRVLFFFITLYDFVGPTVADSTLVLDTLILNYLSDLESRRPNSMRHGPTDGIPRVNVNIAHTFSKNESPVFRDLRRSVNLPAHPLPFSATPADGETICGRRVGYAHGNKRLHHLEGHAKRFCKEVAWEASSSLARTSEGTWQVADRAQLAWALASRRQSRPACTQCRRPAQ